jgi:16S rRNA (cytosine1402-N4)-methyltransferase
MASREHAPVLVKQVVAAFLSPHREWFVDATLGLGGHAAVLLEAMPKAHLLGLDVDGEALEVARHRLAPFARRTVLIRASYWALGDLAHDHHLDKVGGVLFDLGVSSLQLDTAARGFSFRHDGPLDMRFGSDGPTAAEILAEVGEEELVRFLRDLGEEPHARRVARTIVRARARQPIRTTGELARLVHAALGPSRGRIDPATRTFQALRLATNRELDGIPPALEQAARLLRPGGRLAVIAFHSLEDRLVKRTLRRLSGRCVCPPGTLACQCHPERLLDILTAKPTTPGTDELADNPRARSAKLRVAARSGG